MTASIWRARGAEFAAMLEARLRASEIRNAANGHPYMANEESIVWLSDPNGFHYLNEGVVVVRARVGLVHLRRGWRGQLIGYADLRKGTRSDLGNYLRRVWWLKEYPPDDDIYTRDWVDPSSIAPGQESIKGQRRGE